MNFQEMDALGGLLEGSKFRMAEDTTRINQQNVMEQIAKAAQDRQFEAEMHPLKKQAEEALVRDRDLSAKVRQQQLDQGQEKFTREQGQAYVQDVIQQGSLPGAEDFFATKYKVPADHPIRMAVKQAREQSQGWDSSKGPSPLEQLLAKIANSDDKSRQAEASAEAAHKRTVAQQDAMTKRNEATIASKERINAAMIAARRSMEELKLKAKELNIPDLEAYATRLMFQADQLERAGKTEEAANLRNDAEKAMQQAIRLQAAKGTAAFEAEAARLSAITGGKINVTGSGQAGAGRAAAAGPKVGGGTGPSTVTSPGGRQVTIKPKEPAQNPNSAAGQGAPSPAVAPAPQSSNEVPAEMAVPASYVEKTLKREGTGQNPRSSAVGTGQFINDTMLTKFKEWYPQKAAGMTDEQILNLRTTDPALMKDMTRRYASENGYYLKKAGHPVNEDTLYLAHHFGLEGAKKVLTAENPGRRVADLLSPQVIKANPHIRHMTVRDLMDWISQKRYH